MAQPKKKLGNAPRIEADILLATSAVAEDSVVLLKMSFPLNADSTLKFDALHY